MNWFCEPDCHLCYWPRQLMLKRDPPISIGKLRSYSQQMKIFHYGKSDRSHLPFWIDGGHLL